MAEDLLRVMGALVLLVAPGAWVSVVVFKKVELHALLLSVVLSPLVLVLEFFLLRTAGLRFETATYGAVVMNLPIFLWLMRHLFRWGQNETTIALKHRALLMAMAIVPLAALFLMHLFDLPWRYFSAHPWMHADFVYAIANGALVPEEPGLAGIQIGYPYLAHVCQAMLSFLLDSPPQSSYVWSNLTWAICIIFLGDAAAKKIGGGIRCRVFTFLFMFFGLDGFSFLCEFVMPMDLVEKLHLEMGWRYSPWCWKFHSFDQMPMSLVVFGATVVALIDDDREHEGWQKTLVVTLLCVSQAIFYPILFPVSLALLGLRFLISFFRKKGGMALLKETLIPLVISTIVLVLWIKFVTTSHVDGKSIRLHTFDEFLMRSYRLLVAGAFLGVWIFGFRRSLRNNAHATWMLLGCMFASIALNVIFFIPWLENEYKYLFTMAFCAAPFCGLAVEKWLPTRSSAWVPLAVALCLISSTMVLKRVSMRDENTADFAPPLVDASQFDMRLDASEELAEPLDAIREGSPVDAVFVHEAVSFHAAGVVQRSMFIPPTQERGYAGYGIQNRTMLRFNIGYSHRLIDERSEMLARFFGTPLSFDPTPLLTGIGELGRPAVVLLERARHGYLIAWFAASKIGHVILDNGLYQVILVNRP